MDHLTLDTFIAGTIESEAETLPQSIATASCNQLLLFSRSALQGRSQGRSKTM